jgi:hypothetical protein
MVQKDERMSWARQQKQIHIPRVMILWNALLRNNSHNLAQIKSDTHDWEEAIQMGENLINGQVPEKQNE